MDKLIQGKYYHLTLVSPYSVVGEYDVYISAIARKATLSMYGDFDIRETFFTPAGVGIRRYLETVTDTTDIYICHPISSTDPIEVSDSDFIFIPFSIIDFNKVEEYVTATRFQFNIEGVRRRFDSDIDKQEFLDNLEENITHALDKETSLANDTLSISDTQEDHLVLQSVIQSEEENREAYIRERQNAVTKKLQDEADREMNYYKRMKDLQNKEAIYEKNISNINTLITQAETAKTIGAKFLLNVDDLMSKIRDLYAQFTRYANNYNYPIPEWDNLFKLVYKSADGTGTGISTDQWLEMMVLMAQGSIPEELTNVEMPTCPLCGTDLNIIVQSSNEE